MRSQSLLLALFSNWLFCPTTARFHGLGRQHEHERDQAPAHNSKFSASSIARGLTGNVAGEIQAGIHRLSPTPKTYTTLDIRAILHSILYTEGSSSDLITSTTETAHISDASTASSPSTQTGDASTTTSTATSASEVSTASATSPNEGDNIPYNASIYISGTWGSETYNSSGKCTNLLTIDGWKALLIDNLEISPGLSCQFFYYPNCTSPLPSILDNTRIYRANDSSNTQPPTFSSFQCWPKLCAQPVLNLTAAETYTCNSDAILPLYTSLPAGILAPNGKSFPEFVPVADIYEQEEYVLTYTRIATTGKTMTQSTPETNPSPSAMSASTSTSFLLAPSSLSSSTRLSARITATPPATHSTDSPSTNIRSATQANLETTLPPTLFTTTVPSIPTAQTSSHFPRCPHFTGDGVEWIPCTLIKSTPISTIWTPANPACTTWQEGWTWSSRCDSASPVPSKYGG